MYCRLIIFFKKVLTAHDFINLYRRNDKDLTHQSNLPFQILFVFLINYVRGSYQDEIYKFFQTICWFDVAKRVVSKAALTKARMKIKFEAFIDLSLHIIHYFGEHFKPRRWFGFRLGLPKP